MPRILILHATLGTGHLSAARALGQAFARYPEVDCRIEDILDHVGPVLRPAMKLWYEGLSEKAPPLYRFIYESSNTGDVEDPGSGSKLLGLMERSLMTDLEEMIVEAAPDVVLSVHPVSIQLLRHLKTTGQLTAKHYIVITDFMAHSTWLSDSVDGYFVPGEFTRYVLQRRGVDPSLLHVTGIPISLEIAEPKSPLDMRLKHELPTDRPLVSLFAGGIDAKRVRLMVERLLEGDQPTTLTVVAGRNEEVGEALADLTDGPQVQLRLLGRIDYVDDLVTASDLVISKAGGLIVSEVMARSIPMIIIDPLPGQEEWNADLVAGSSAGVQLRMPEMVPLAALYLLGQPDKLAAMREQAGLLGRPRAAQDVAEQVLAALHPPQATVLETA